MKLTFVPYTRGFNALTGITPDKHFTFIPVDIDGHDFAHKFIDKFIAERGIEGIAEGWRASTVNGLRTELLGLRTNNGVIATIQLSGPRGVYAICELTYDGFLRIEP